MRLHLSRVDLWSLRPQIVRALGAPEDGGVLFGEATLGKTLDEVPAHRHRASWRADLFAEMVVADMFDALASLPGLSSLGYHEILETGRGCDYLGLAGVIVPHDPFGEVLVAPGGAPEVDPVAVRGAYAQAKRVGQLDVAGGSWRAVRQVYDGTKTLVDAHPDPERRVKRSAAPESDWTTVHAPGAHSERRDPNQPAYDAWPDGGFTTGWAPIAPEVVEDRDAVRALVQGAVPCLAGVCDHWHVDTTEPEVWAGRLPTWAPETVCPEPSVQSLLLDTMLNRRRSEPRRWQRDALVGRAVNAWSWERIADALGRTVDECQRAYEAELSRGVKAVRALALVAA
ncbi:hypothetical protein [Cellulosimicrobium funkei]|uniref:hypothetical protein n=1 Tax=Cellulosimicrobium funkei TaxID=264251 RepID=UPI0034479720